MKLFLAAWALCFGVWLKAAAARAGDSAPVLFVAGSSSADQAAIERLSGLTTGPQRSVRVDGDALAWARRAVAAERGTRAVVIDTARRRVDVVEPDGSIRTRLIEGVPTAYVTAFVASELLRLDSSHARSVQPPAQASHKQGTQPLARFAASLALDVARTYTTRTLFRPRLGLSAWLRGPHTRACALLGASFAGPGHVQRDLNTQGDLSLTRYDTALYAGAAIVFSRVRFLAALRGVAGFQRARLAGPFGIDRHALSLGVGAGLGLELGLTRWLALHVGSNLDVLTRRNAFNVQVERVLREHLLVFSASVGLVFSTASP